MIIQVYSDIHLEYLKSIPIFTPKCDVLVLAGDIGQIHLPSYKLFMDYVSNNWKKVFCVLGNHEYYSDKLSYEELRKKYNTFFQKYHNITLLDTNKETYKGIDFLGCTLWGYYPKNCDTNYINLLNRIKNRDSNNKLISLKRDYLNKINQQEKKWIKDNIDLNRKTILITHYPTIIQGTSSPKWKNEKFKTLFANDLPIKCINLTAISGHTHFCYDFTDSVTGTRHIGNHRGYKDEIEAGEMNFNHNGLCRL